MQTVDLFNCCMLFRLSQLQLQLLQIYRCPRATFLTVPSLDSSWRRQCSEITRPPPFWSRPTADVAFWRLLGPDHHHFLSGLDRRNCLIRKGLVSDLANGRSADGRGVLRRAWTRQRHGPLQMSARTWSAIRNTVISHETWRQTRVLVPTCLISGGLAGFWN